MILLAKIFCIKCILVILKLSPEIPSILPDSFLGWCNNHPTPVYRFEAREFIGRSPASADQPLWPRAPKREERNSLA